MRFRCAGIFNTPNLICVCLLLIVAYQNLYRTFNIKEEIEKAIKYHMDKRESVKEDFTVSIQRSTAKSSDIKQFRILCWVLTNPGNLQRKTQFIKKTWGKRCDITLYMSSKPDIDFPAVGLNITGNESKTFNSLKVKRAWSYVYHNHLLDADFFIKTDDDTYLIVENLRHFLSTKDPDKAEFYGRRFILPSKKVIYMSGGGGLAMTRESLKRLVEKAFTNSSCLSNGMGEDWKVCQCLQWVGAKPIDTRDELGRETFHSFDLKSHLKGNYPKWFQIYDMDGAKSGDECCSDFPITFHYVSGEAMLAMDRLLYTIKVFGLNKDV